MGREKSDDSVVPESRRKSASTASQRGGKGVTVSQQASQLELFFDTAESPQGDDAGAVSGLPVSSPRAVPKSKSTKRSALPAMTVINVASPVNLESAFDRVYANRGAAGPDRQSVDDVRKHLATLLPTLSASLLDGSYQPGNIRRVWIPKQKGLRGLGIPNVVDRLVAQAIAQVMSPHYEPTFHPSSHGFRPDRSCHTAIDEARRYLADGRDWVVDIDLAQFFDRVNHDRLMARLGERVQDPCLLRLIRRMLKAKVVLPDGVIVASDEGVPQGGPLSPLLSNIVLDELDWELSQRGHCFVRYADDRATRVA